MRDTHELDVKPRKSESSFVSSLLNSLNDPQNIFINDEKSQRVI